MRAFCSVALLSVPVAFGTPNGAGSTPAVAAPAAVARWDRHVVDRADEVAGLQPSARDTIETWRRFAERRGYRIDLDPSQRALVVSDAVRFESFVSSATIIERVLDELEPITGPSESPIVLLRARDADDLIDAVRGASALGVDTRMGAYVETGGLGDRRNVDARLAEQLTRAALEVDAPSLSVWMADGIASHVAIETTGRAIIDEQPMTLRQVKAQVVAEHRHDRKPMIDLLKIAGTRGGVKADPLEAEALAVVTFLAEHHRDSLPEIIEHLGHHQPPASTAKYRQEEETLRHHIGLTALEELQRFLREGRYYRP